MNKKTKQATAHRPYSPIMREVDKMNAWTAGKEDGYLNSRRDAKAYAKDKELHDQYIDGWEIGRALRESLA